MIECSRCGSGNATGRSRCRRCDAALAGAPPKVTEDAVIDYSTSGRGGATKVLKLSSEPDSRLRSRPKEVPFKVSPDSADVFTSVPMNEASAARAGKANAPASPGVVGVRRVRADAPTDSVSLETARPSTRARKPPPPLPTEEVQTIVRKIGRTRPRSAPAISPAKGDVAYVPGKGIIPRTGGARAAQPRPSGPPPVPTQVRAAAPQPVKEPPDKATLVTAQPISPGQAAADMADVARLGALFADSPTRTQIDALPMDSVTLEQLDADGNIGVSRPLETGRWIIGRQEGDILLPHDNTVSPWHAQIFVRKNGVFIKDMDTPNGVHVQIPGEIALTDGDSLLMGGQRFVFRDSWDAPKSTQGAEIVTETLGAEGYDDPARLILLRVGGQVAGVYFVGEGLTVGRVRGALLFAADARMSPSHARIRRVEGQFILSDESGGGGVYIAIRGEVELNDQHGFQVGRTRFRIVL